MAKAAKGKGLRGPVKGNRLTPKMACFALEYIVDLNATAAATRAGYSEKTARWQGARLLENPLVAEEITRLMDERSTRTKIGADWILRRLAAEADADMADIYNRDMTLKPVHDWPEIWRKGLVAGVDVQQIMEGAGTIVKVKISDRIKRLELLGKHVDVGAFRDKVSVENPDGSPLQVIVRRFAPDGDNDPE